MTQHLAEEVYLSRADDTILRREEGGLAFGGMPELVRAVARAAPPAGGMERSVDLPRLDGLESARTHCGVESGCLEKMEVETVLEVVAISRVLRERRGVVGGFGREECCWLRLR
jgi:hypothetical protein